MKRLFVFAATALFAVNFISCSNEAVEKVDDSKLSIKRVKAIENYNDVFNSNLNYLVKTRSITDCASQDNYDSISVVMGKEIVEKLSFASNTLIAEFGITDNDFIEVIKEVTEEQNLIDVPSLEEAKCITALSILDIYLHDKDNILNTKTRANELDYILCLGGGFGVKDMVNAGGRAIAKKILTRAAVRMMPGFGWAYGAMSAAYCIANL